jgi:hypothetical protein
MESSDKKPYLPKYFAAPIGGWGCYECGAHVIDVAIHTAFHEKLKALLENKE